MRARGDVERPGQLVEVRDWHDREAPLQGRADRAPALVVVVRTEATAARGAIVDHERRQDRIVLQEGSRDGNDALVFHHEAEVGIGEATLRQGIAARRWPDDVAGAAVERRIVFETALEPLQRRLVDLAAQQQIAVALVAFDLFGGQHGSPPSLKSCARAYVAVRDARRVGGASNARMRRYARAVPFLPTRAAAVVKLVSLSHA